MSSEHLAVCPPTLPFPLCSTSHRPFGNQGRPTRTLVCESSNRIQPSINQSQYTVISIHVKCCFKIINTQYNVSQTTKKKIIPVVGNALRTFTKTHDLCHTARYIYYIHWSRPMSWTTFIFTSRPNHCLNLSPIGKSLDSMTSINRSL